MAPPIEIAKITGKNVLASYAIPLVKSEAKLDFSGDKLTAEDFDTLIEYVELFKKCFEKKASAEKLATENSENQTKIED